MFRQPTEFSPTLGLLAAALIVLTGGGMLAASPSAADEYEQLRRTPTVRAPQIAPGASLHHSPGVGDIVPLPGQPQGPPSPRPPQHEAPCSIAPRPAGNCASGAPNGMQPAWLLPWQSALGWAWLSGWRLF